MSTQKTFQTEPGTRLVKRFEGVTSAPHGGPRLIQKRPGSPSPRFFFSNEARGACFNKPTRNSAFPRILLYGSISFLLYGSFLLISSWLKKTTCVLSIWNFLLISENRLDARSKRRCWKNNRNKKRIYRALLRKIVYQALLQKNKQVFCSFQWKFCYGF